MILSGPGGPPIVAPAATPNSELVSVYLLFFVLSLLEALAFKELYCTAAAKAEDSRFLFLLSK